jgi:predicted negative regulator of RcsB-dependent stress response
VLWVKGDREKAMEVWQQALEENPDNSLLQEAMERLDIDRE